MKLESNWLYLETQLINYIDATQPNLQIIVRDWLIQIQFLPIQERTLYLTALVKILKEVSIHNNPSTQKIRSVLEANNNLDVQGIKSFEKSIQRWLLEKRNEGN